MASLMPKYIEKETGISSFIGYSKELDMIKPDYDLIKTGTKWDEYSFVFTTRGCINKCPYCAVPTLEPGYWINPRWKETIDFRRLKIILFDNNLTAAPIEHFENVMYFLKKHKLEATFDSGFDCRIFNEHHMKALKEIRVNPRGLRFAFDHMGQEGYIQNTLKTCLKNGFKPRDFQIYVLFNFKDTPQEAEYRMREIMNLGITPYPQRYVPLDQLDRSKKHVGKYWTEKLAHAFRVYYQPQRISTTSKLLFPNWLRKNQEKELLKQFNEHPFKK